MVEIPSYQIHKVMKVYAKQLTQSKLFERQTGGSKKATAADRISISMEGNRQAIINNPNKPSSFSRSPPKKGQCLVRMQF